MIALTEDDVVSKAHARHAGGDPAPARGRGSVGQATLFLPIFLISF
jgi:hypothetical protein